MRKALLVLAVLSITSGAFPVYAAVIGTQADSSTQYNGVTNTYWGNVGGVVQTIGTSTSYTTGFFGSFSFYAQINGGNNNLSVQLFDCGSQKGDNECQYNGATWMQNTNYWNLKTNDSALTNSFKYFTFVSTSTLITLDSTHRYKFVIFPTTNSGTQLFYTKGTTGSSYSNGRCEAQFYSSPTACVGINDLAFTLTTAEISLIQPQVYPILTPTQFQITSSNFVGVGFNYYNTNVYDTVGVEIIDQSNNYLVLRTGQIAAQHNDLYSYNTAITLTCNHAYRIRGVLSSSVSSSTAAFGPYTDFSTCSDQFFNATSSLINIVNLNDNNATSSINDASNGWTNIPSYFAKRVPWGYLFDIAALYDNAATSSTEFGAITLDLKSLSIATATKSFLPDRFTLLSTTTATQYLGTTLLNVFNTLVVAVGWVGLMGYWYKRGIAI